jgi:hypothetical protein
MKSDVCSTALNDTQHYYAVDVETCAVQLVKRLLGVSHSKVHRPL